jgi:hypothetical protein
LAGLFSFVLGAACFGQAQVLTQANDIYRSGVNASEVTLNTGNVSAGTFGPLFQLPLDGQAYAQPLYVPGIKMQDGNVHNLIITATEHDSVYAYDADSGSTTPLWQTSFINPSAGITTVPYTDITTANDIHPEIGITSTPVITLNQLTGDGVIYVTAKTKEVSGSTVNYVWRLHALDLITGQDLPNSPAVISASVPGTGMGAVNGSVPFIPMVQNQRPAILLDNGVLYLAFGSHGDVGNYHGWVLAYNPTTLSQVGAWCSDPNGEDGGIWQAGHGLADDGRGNIVFETGNGTYDPSSGNWGDSFVRLSPASSGLSAIDSFTPASQLSWDAFDVDLGSSGPLVIPSLGLVVGGGKDGRIYALNSSSLGGYNFLVDTNALQIVMTGNQQVISSQIALINGNSGFLYTGVQGDHIRAYSFTGNPSQPISTASSAESQEDPGSGAFMSISTNAYQPGTSILWATMTLNGRGQAQAIPGVLRAYDATTLKELYNSSSPPNNNNCFAKFVCPTVANGKVYVSYFPPEGAATGASIIGYGLLGNFSKAPNAPAGFSGVSDNGADELSWTPTSGALSYNVYRGPAGGPLSVLQSGVASACYKDTSVSNGSTYVYAVTAVNSAGESAQSSAVTCSPASTFLLYGNQCGTGSDGIFAVDANYSGGTPLANPLLSAAGTVYSSARVGTFTYTLSGIVPNANYTLTLYFDELQYTQPGQRLERVICNGHTIVVNLDLVQQAGAEVGFSQTFAVTGNQNGQITFTCEPMANSPVQSATLSGFTITGSSLMVPPITHNLQATGFVAYNSLTWDPTPGATTYNLYRGTTPGGETLYESGLHDTAFVDWETTYGQPYYYYVTSVNSHGEGMHSSEKSSTAYDVTPTLSVQNVTVHRGATVTFQLTLACSGSPTNNPSITPWYFDTNFLGKLELQGNSWPVNSPMTVTLICSRSAVVGASSVQICVTLGPDIHWVAVPITVT